MSYRIDTTGWNESQHKIKSLRERVFVLEWQIPSKLEFDDNDVHAHHVIVSDELGNAIATARLTQSGEIGRIAVSKSHRSLKLYKALFKCLLDVAVHHDIKTVTVRCNLEGVPALKQRGFQPTGRVFMEAGIPMQRLSIPQMNEIVLPDIRQLH